MPLEIEPVQVQSKFPLEKKPSLDPFQKEIYSDVFSLQNSFKILFLVLDNTFKKIQDYINGGGGGIPDAPTDGTLYGRKDAAWEAVPTPSVSSGYYTLESSATIAAGNTEFTITLADTEINAYDIEISAQRPSGGASSTVLSLQFLTGAAVPSTEPIYMGRIDGAITGNLGTTSPGILKFAQTQNTGSLDQISSIRLSFGQTGRAVSCETRTAFWENSTVSDTTCLAKITGIKFTVTGETQWTHKVAVFARRRLPF